MAALDERDEVAMKAAGASRGRSPCGFVGQCRARRVERMTTLYLDARRQTQS
jgi:hypothetical protein